MKKLIAFILIGFVIASCGSDGPKEVKIGKGEKVVTSFADGAPQIVRTLEEKNGKLVGIYEKEYYDDGNLLKEGSIVNNKRHGYWKAYYRSGNIWNEGMFYEGMRDDTIKGYYTNGNLKYKGLYFNGQKTGVWLIWDEDGTLIENTVYMQPGEKREEVLITE